MPDINIKPLVKETLVKMVDNSVGSKMFNTIYVEHIDTGEIKDVLNDGEYSCAFYVSSILYLMRMMSETCATVSTLRNKIDHDPKWAQREIGEQEAGDIVFYEMTTFADGSKNAHVGFITSKDAAISTDYNTKSIVKHSLNARPIDAIYKYNFDN